MDIRVRQTLLYDFDGELLNDHQKSVYSAYLFDDMSYTELADEFGGSRQAAFDLIRRINGKLEDYEKRLGLLERFLNARKNMQELADSINRVKEQIDASDIDSKDKKKISDDLEIIKSRSEDIFEDF